MVGRWLEATWRRLHLKSGSTLSVVHPRRFASHPRLKGQFAFSWARDIPYIAIER